MKLFLTVTSALVLVASVSFAEGKPNKEEMKAAMKAKAEQVTAACAADAKTAGCDDKAVGHGMMKCIHEYKMKNKDFKLSEPCMAMAKEGREAMKEHREMHKEKK